MRSQTLVSSNPSPDADADILPHQPDGQEDHLPESMTDGFAWTTDSPGVAQAATWSILLHGLEGEEASAHRWVVMKLFFTTTHSRNTQRGSL